MLLTGLLLVFLLVVFLKHLLLVRFGIQRLRLLLSLVSGRSSAELRILELDCHLLKRLVVPLIQSGLALFLLWSAPISFILLLDEEGADGFIKRLRKEGGVANPLTFFLHSDIGSGSGIASYKVSCFFRSFSRHRVVSL